MRLPTLEKARPFHDRPGVAAAAGTPALLPQGCSALEWIGCAAAIAGCATLSGPALVACVAAAAPNCVKCL